MMQAISGVHFNYSFPAQFWEVYADVRAQRAPATPCNSARPATSTCCATSGAWAGWCCTCSAPRRRWAAISWTSPSRACEVLDARTAYGPYATSLRMSDIGYRNRNQAGVSRVGQQPRRIPARPEARGDHAASGLREDRPEARRRLAAAFHQRAADRERVLQPDPAQARGPFRREPEQCPAARRRGIHRDARAGCLRLRSGGRQPDQAALSGSLRGAVPAEGQSAHRPRENRRPSTTTS